jgi:hypothetical protein
VTNKVGGVYSSVLWSMCMVIALYSGFYSMGKYHISVTSVTFKVV